MPTFDLNVDRALQPKPKRSRSGFAIAGWTLFVIVLAFFGYLGYKTVFYYQKIQHGEIVDLPQFNDGSHFTSASGVAAGPFDVAAAMVESADAPSTGPEVAAAKLTVVEFADFQCAYSKDEASVVRTLMTKYGDRVRFEFRDYPLDSIHPDASNAALAARCAQEQGKFWAYHDKLFVNSPALSLTQLSQYAEESGLDAKQFDRCLADQRNKDKVDQDRATAEQIGLAGTPTFFFNGKRVDGAIPADTFENLIQKMLQ